MKKSVILIGTGGHARVLLDSLQLRKVRVLGVTDLDYRKLDPKQWSVPILGSDESILRYAPDRVLLVNGVGSIKVSSKRAKIFKSFKKKGYQFAQVIHPSAILSKEIFLGEGVQIMAGVVVQIGTRIGDNTIINTRASIDHDCRIGAHAHIAPGVILCGGVHIGDGCHIGVGSTVIQNIQIAANCFVRASSLVHHNQKV